MAIMDISAELMAYQSRENVFGRLSKEFKRQTKKNVYADFAFPKCGKVMGIIRHIIQNPKKEEQLLKIAKIDKAIVEFFRDVAGNTSYLSADGEIVKTKQMDIERTQAVVKLVSQQLGMVLDDEDILNEINANRWKDITKLAERRAKKSKKALEEIDDLSGIEEIE